MADARFEDGEEGPLRLIARQAEDVVVLSSLLQDAVFPMSEMRYDRKARRFALLVNRFRWEDRAAAEAANAADFLRALPEGLDTYLGEGGARLS